MERPGYERFGLVVNPFHDLSSETLDEIEAYHVSQQTDVAFESLKQQVLERQAKAVVLVTGAQGMGKTQRLKVTESQAKRVGGATAFQQVGDSAAATVVGLAQALAAARPPGGMFKSLNPPHWMRELRTLAKSAAKRLDPSRAGKTIAQALNASAPAFLLVNDLDGLESPEESAALAKVLEVVTSQIEPGVMVVATCRPAFLRVLEGQPNFATRINRVVSLVGLTANEVQLLIAKRLTGRRLVEDLDPLYPFTPEALAVIQEYAPTPRRLLQLADLVLDGAVREHAFQVTADLARQTLQGEVGAHMTLSGASPPSVGSPPVAPAALRLAPRKPPAGPKPTDLDEVVFTAVPAATRRPNPAAQPAPRPTKSPAAPTLSTSPANGHALKNGHGAAGKVTPVVGGLGRPTAPIPRQDRHL
jgi:hypothetical protein